MSRVSLFLAAAIAAQLPAAAQSPRRADTVQHIEIRAQSIESFDPREPARTRFGNLEFRGGLVLESKHRDFGGLSALHMMANGENFLSLSDKGHWLRGRIVYRDGRPVSVADAEMAPILGADGKPLAGRGWYDTESLAVDEGTIYVGIERVNKIVRLDYGKDGLLARGRPIPVPPGIGMLPHNKGLECLAMAPKEISTETGPGTLIAISERGLDTNGNILGFLLQSGSGTFALKRTDDFDVSDCVVAPDGRLLVLERRFSWAQGTAMRIRSVPLMALKPGAVLDGTQLIFADMAYEIDNMEGLAVHRTADGALVLTLISDDNFSPLQRTVLLQFALVGE
jgi:hypothetical protein